MPQPEAPRYRIDNVAALVRVMHQDRRYALLLRDLAEDHVTLRLRSKFFRVSPGMVVDAFNEAFMNLLRSKTFRDDQFMHGQPATGWTALELVREVIGGYLYVSSLHELARQWRKQHLEAAGPDDRRQEDDYYNLLAKLPDERERSDPGRHVEHEQAVRQLRLCIEKLDARERQALTMYLDEVPIREIALQLNEDSADNMKTRLHRLRQRVVDCAKRSLR